VSQGFIEGVLLLVMTAAAVTLVEVLDRLRG
jgi:hypothetical protein